MANTLPNASPNQTYVQISAIATGHITLPEAAFLSLADPNAQRTVPSLPFFVTYPGVSLSLSVLGKLPTNRPLHILFDLGLPENILSYSLEQRKHLGNRRPFELLPSVPEALKCNGIELETIGLIVLSHVH
jgi:hypothetical protein